MDLVDNVPCLCRCPRVPSLAAGTPAAPRRRAARRRAGSAACRAAHGAVRGWVGRARPALLQMRLAAMAIEPGLLDDDVTLVALLANSTEGQAATAGAGRFALGRPNASGQSPLTALTRRSVP